MASTPTKNRDAGAQWRAAWALLPREWRDAIALFCKLTDGDVYAAAFEPVFIDLKL